MFRIRWIPMSLVLGIGFLIIGQGGDPLLLADGPLHTAMYDDLYTFDQEWTVETLGDGYNPSMDLDSAGHAHIVYSHDGDLRYATNTSGQWESRTVDTGGIEFSTIAVDSLDDVHISYCQQAGADSFLKYINNTTGSWRPVETVVEDNCCSVSMDTGSDNKVHISYIQGCWGAPLVYVTNESGGWMQETASGHAYNSASIAVDSNNKAHISYYSLQAVGLMYVTNAPAGSWQSPEKVDRVGGQLEGIVTSVAIDSVDAPHISYVGGPMEDNRYATRSSSSWITETVDSGDFSSVGNSIAVDPDNNAHMSYYYMATDEIRYATNASGVWVKETVDGGGAYVGGLSIAIAVDSTGAVHVSYRDDAGDIKYATQPAEDGDDDGVPDAEEQGPDGSDANYDGNGDGVPDSQQGNVASFHTHDREHYVTLATPDGTALGDVQAVDNPSPSDTPSDADFAYGFFAFTIDSVEIGGAVTATFHLSAGTTPVTYYQHGPTPDTPANHWYEFLYDGETGAEIDEGVITLHFVDGARGDHDLTVNGQIVEPGGPASPISRIYLALVLRND